MGSFQCIRGAAVAAVGVGIALAGTGTAKAQQASVLHVFPYIDGKALDGIGLNGQLAMDSAGNLYGTAHQGGDNNLGTVYEFSPNNGFSKLISFDFQQTGALPIGGPIVNDQGQLAGTTPFGGQFGYGAVYQIDLAPRVLRGYDIASLPSFGTLNSGLVYRPFQGYFGTSATASESSVYFVHASGSAVLTEQKFTTSTGTSTNGALAHDSAGNIYGVTGDGGANGKGAIFRFSTVDGTLSTVADLPAWTATQSPTGGLAIDAAGDIFGSNGTGVFEYSATTGILSQLVTLDIGTLGQPNQDISVDGSGNLYGSTGRYVFEIDAASHAVSILANANQLGGTANGEGTIIDVDWLNGNLYGVTGGDGTSAGTLFEIALPEPSAISFVGLGLLGLLRRRACMTH